MNDICAIIIPKNSNPSEVLLVDIYDIVHLTTPSSAPSQISFLDKLSLVNTIDTDYICKENSCKCAFLPFFISKNLNYSNGKSFALNLLKKIVSLPPAIAGYLYFAKRIVIEGAISYNVIIYFTDPIDTQHLKINNCFWIDKENLKVFHNIYGYYNMGNELENILPLKEPSEYLKNKDSNLYEYKLTPITAKTLGQTNKNKSLLEQIVLETNTDIFIQNYVFADFMINAYPCQVMCYPQFIGFAVARGLYPKRLKRIFKVLTEAKEMYLTYENFLFGCICMDLASEHSNMTRVARAGLIFKYYDKNDNERLDFLELFCMVKKMRKKMGYTENTEEVRQATKKIMGLLNKSHPNIPIDQQNITLSDFVKGLHYPELWGLTFLLRFSMPYLIKTRHLMGKYIESSQIVLLRELDTSTGNGLIPYFIKEAYSTEELFNSMIYYSKNYENLQELLQKMDDKNKLAITKFKAFNILSNFFNQILYYLSEMAFDIYNSEGLFPLRNPLFLTLIMTTLAVVYPALFSNSTLLWQQILAYFTTGIPTLIYASHQLLKKPVQSLPNAYQELKSKAISIRSNHWITRRDKLAKREDEIEAKNSQNIGKTPKDSLQKSEEPNKNLKNKINDDDISAFKDAKTQPFKESGSSEIKKNVKQPLINPKEKNDIILKNESKVPEIKIDLQKNLQQEPLKNSPQKSDKDVGIQKEIPKTTLPDDKKSERNVGRQKPLKDSDSNKSSMDNEISAFKETPSFKIKENGKVLPKISDENNKVKLNELPKEKVIAKTEIQKPMNDIKTPVESEKKALPNQVDKVKIENLPVQSKEKMIVKTEIQKPINDIKTPVESEKKVLPKPVDKVKLENLPIQAKEKVIAKTEIQKPPPVDSNLKIQLKENASVPVKQPPSNKENSVIKQDSSKQKVSEKDSSKEKKSVEDSSKISNGNIILKIGTDLNKNRNVKENLPIDPKIQKSKELESSKSKSNFKEEQDLNSKYIPQKKIDQNESLKIQKDIITAKDNNQKSTVNQTQESVKFKIEKPKPETIIDNSKNKAQVQVKEKAKDNGMFFGIFQHNEQSLKANDKPIESAQSKEKSVDVISNVDLSKDKINPKMNMDNSTYSNDKQSSYIASDIPSSHSKDKVTSNWETDITSQSKDVKDIKSNVNTPPNSSEKEKVKIDVPTKSYRQQLDCDKPAKSKTNIYSIFNKDRSSPGKCSKDSEHHEELQSPYFETDIESCSPSVASKMTEESKCADYVCKVQRENSESSRCSFKGCRNSCK